MDGEAVEQLSEGERPGCSDSSILDESLLTPKVETCVFNVPCACQATRLSVVVSMLMKVFVVVVVLGWRIEDGEWTMLDRIFLR